MMFEKLMIFFVGIVLGVNLVFVFAVLYATKKKDEKPPKKEEWKVEE